MKRIVIAAVLGALVALGGGCPPPRVEIEPRVMKSATYAELLESHNANAARIASLSADLKMTAHYSERGRAKKSAADALLNIEKPRRLRLKHYGGLGRPLFYVLSDGRRYWIALDHVLSGGDDVVYSGGIGALEQKYYLRPDWLLDAIALPALPPEGTVQQITEEHPDKYIFTFIDGARPPRIFARAVFSRADLALQKYRLFDAANRLALDVGYVDYNRVGNVRVPKDVFIAWPLADSSFAVRLTDTKVNLPFAPEVWQYHWYPDWKMIEDKPAPADRSPRKDRRR